MLWGNRRLAAAIAGLASVTFTAWLSSQGVPSEVALTAMTLEMAIAGFRVAQRDGGEGK